MSLEWTEVRINDVGKIVTGKTPKTSIEDNYGGTIPFLTPSDDMDIKKEYIEGLQFHFVDNMLEVLDLALEKEQEVNSLDYNKFLVDSHKKVAGFKA